MGLNSENMANNNTYNIEGNITVGLGIPVNFFVLNKMRLKEKLSNLQQIRSRIRCVNHQAKKKENGIIT